MYYKCYTKAKVSWSDEGWHAAWHAREGEKQHRLLSLACLHVKTKKQSTRLVLTDDCSCLLSCCGLWVVRAMLTTGRLRLRLTTTDWRLRMPLHAPLPSGRTSLLVKRTAGQGIIINGRRPWCSRSCSFARACLPFLMPLRPSASSPPPPSTLASFPPHTPTQAGNNN